MKPDIKPYQNLMLSLLRQKLKTYQNELNLKYIRIYEFRDQYIKKIKEISSQELKNDKITLLDNKLKELTDLLPETIVGKSDDDVQKIIQNMIDTFENNVKP